MWHKGVGAGCQNVWPLEDAGFQVSAQPPPVLSDEDDNLELHGRGHLQHQLKASMEHWAWAWPTTAVKGQHALTDCS